MPGIGQASAEGSRPLPTDGVHGCFVGNGLDRSGDVCRCCMVKYCCGVGAAYMRPGSVRQTGAYGKPAGRACPAPTARQPKSVHQRSHPGHLSSQPAFPSHLHGRVYISSQNHGYAVDPESLDPQVAVPAFTNVNDGTNEGLKYVGKNIFTVQYHPEACPGPQDSSYLFDRFLKMMEEKKNA